LPASFQKSVLYRHEKLEHYAFRSEKDGKLTEYHALLLGSLPSETSIIDSLNSNIRTSPFPMINCAKGPRTQFTQFFKITVLDYLQFTM
jgi:hypothetical protein